MHNSNIFPIFAQEYKKKGKYNMEFLILLGFLSFLTMIVSRDKLFFEENIDYDACDVELQKQAAKRNKLFWNIFFYGGFALMVLGVIGVILF